MSATDQTKIYTVAPTGFTTVAEWGSLILERHVPENGLDLSRPPCAEMVCDLPVKEDVSWLDLWKEREDNWREILNKIDV